jgi:hypothetical protein
VGTDEGFSLEDRVLCPDGSCVGVIGPDGRCKVCGAPSPDRHDSPPPPQTPERGDEAPPVPADPPAPDSSDRVCCPDGACVGIIGPEGRCGICGRSV